jgi:CRISPR/Cas system-associated endonuclease Cas3-HD
MSTLEKTIDLLNKMPERQLEIIYSYAKFISSHPLSDRDVAGEDLDNILDNIVGILPDTGKSLDDYRKERISERYELTN